jgi:hypothetical protein
MAGPRWVRLDVDYFANPKALTAGRDGRDLHLASICWVGRYLTDGYIPGDVVDALAREAGVRTVAPAVDRAVAAGLWLPAGNGTGPGFLLHDFTEMNGTRADVERERDLFRQRQQRYRNRKHKDDV